MLTTHNPTSAVLHLHKQLHRPDLFIDDFLNRKNNCEWSIII